ncbi:MAG: peptide ABC transporter substrate-binding protein [Rhodospirillaceae bacterium]|nr:peptide ABC transporter substrate-binding protein [Rhodospirillaceae bacterium]
MRVGLTALFVVAASAPAVAQGLLRVAVPEIPILLDPQRAVTSAERALAAEVFMGLVTHDAEGRPVPGIAESWAVSGDGRRYVFTLRRGLAWSDGRDLVAADVVAGLERALDPATAAPAAPLLLPIRNAAEFQLGTLPPGEGLGATAPDDRTVMIELAGPSARFLHILAEPVAMPVPRHRLRALGEAWSQPFVVVGNGPFDPVPAGDRWALVRNPRYVGPDPPQVERVELVAAADPRTAVLAAGVDMALGFDAEPRRNDDPADAMRGEAGQDTYRLVVNMQRPPLDRREVRHALAMAIDRDEAIAEADLADAAPAYALVPATPDGRYRSPRAPFARLSQADRITVAQALLLDVDRDAPIAVRLAVPFGDTHRAIARVIAANWREIGFQAEISERAAADHERALLAGDFDVAVLTGNGRDTDPWPYLSRFSRAATVWNVARYAETPFDERFAVADLETDVESRLGYLRSAEAVLVEDQVVWPLFQFAAVGPVGPRVAGWTGNLVSRHPLRLVAVP